MTQQVQKLNTDIAALEERVLELRLNYTRAAAENALLRRFLCRFCGIDSSDLPAVLATYQTTIETEQ